ncbi:MAG: hypothetical protein WC717_03925 [Candidatus Micrarchaeia archaeon]|jgi:hypothetical protein
MMSISLDRASYAAGDIVTATISLRREKPAKARGVYASLSCTEQHQVKTTVVIDQYTLDRHKEMGIPYSSNIETRTVKRDSVLFSQEKKLSGEREFSGEEAFTVQFTLPRNASPTSHEFGHDGKIHIWKLSAKLDIPMAMDDNASKEVVVEGL